ncbi:hypothetical protein UlMin_006836 [Ulmus minor]
MAFDLPSVVPASATIFTLLLFLYILLWKPRVSRKLPPEAGGAWPIIGHLPLLGGSQPAHIILGNLADKYGPIFTIKIGVHRNLIVSSWKMAKECFTTNDKAFASRPKALASEILSYNYANFGIGPYSPYWRHIKKIATLKLLSTHRLAMLSHVWKSEVKTAVKELHELWVKDNKVVVEMNKWLWYITLNVLFKIIVGKRFLEATNYGGNEESDEYRRAIRIATELTGTFVASDAIPWLRFLDIGGYEKVMKRTAKKIDKLLQRLLDEHKQKRMSGKLEKADQDFMDVMLSILEGEENISSFDADTIIKANCMALLFAGSDTTMITMIWALSLLLNNREALKKAQQELELHVGRERQVNESDMKNLVYLQAVIKETLRLYPAAPLSLPHEAMEDCNVAGYDVPAGTRLLVNLSKIHRDPKVWSDPCEFKPERFLINHKNLDVRGRNFELIPFGSGRRICPGISLALQVMELTLATLLHGFEITTPFDEPVDMSETTGITNLKVTPLHVLLNPRLPTEVYG